MLNDLNIANPDNDSKSPSKKKSHSNDKHGTRESIIKKKEPLVSEQQ